MRWLPRFPRFFQPSPAPSGPVDLLDLELCRFGPDDGFTLRDACEGTLIIGSTGSGKSTGSGRALQRCLLTAGMGGCVTTTKPGERAEWEAICAETGRLADLVVIGPGSRWRFNFLSHEWTRSGAGAGLTDNIVQLFTLALEAGGRSSKQAGSDPFWRDAGQEFLRSAVDLAARANGTVSLSAIYDIIDSAPLSPEQVLSETWQSESYCFACLETADRNSTSPEQRGDYQQTERYWLRRFPQLAEKTRSIIVTGFTAMADAL